MVPTERCGDSKPAIRAGRDQRLINRPKCRKIAGQREKAGTRRG
jgi:hypothetical protein